MEVNILSSLPCRSPKSIANDIFYQMFQIFSSSVVEWLRPEHGFTLGTHTFVLWPSGTTSGVTTFMYEHKKKRWRTFFLLFVFLTFFIVLFTWTEVSFFCRCHDAWTAQMTSKKKTYCSSYKVSASHQINLSLCHCWINRSSPSGEWIIFGLHEVFCFYMHSNVT